MTSHPPAQPTPPADLGIDPELPTDIVATAHPQQWTASGLPDSLADLTEPLDQVWAALHLALAGADVDTLSHTLGLPENTARRIVIATTEQMLEQTAATPPPRGHIQDL